jgi:hypothetical protein
MDFHHCLKFELYLKNDQEEVLPVLFRGKSTEFLSPLLLLNRKSCRNPGKSCVT